jgi:hypothetical protein
MDQTLHRLAETFGIVTPKARQRTLPPPLRQLHQHILRHFAQHAAAPETQRLREWAHQLDIELDTALGQLVAVDLVEANPATAQLLGAYPFSAIPRGHEVQLAGGPTIEAYCAIDALGIPAMLDRDVVISSQDPHTGEPIRITVTNGQASWQSQRGRCGACDRPKLRSIRMLPLPVHHLPQLAGYCCGPPAGRRPRRRNHHPTPSADRRRTPVRRSPATCRRRAGHRQERVRS